MLFHAGFRERVVVLRSLFRLQLVDVGLERGVHHFHVLEVGFPALVALPLAVGDFAGCLVDRRLKIGA